MIQVRRLGAVGAALALVVVITCTQVLGGPGKDDALAKWRKSGTGPESGKAPADDLADDLAATKFAEQKVVVYQTRDNDVTFGWQLKLAIKAAEDVRPRDFLILVDTSASQSRGPLLAAQKKSPRPSSRTWARTIALPSGPSMSSPIGSPKASWRRASSTTP